MAASIFEKLSRSISVSRKTAIQSSTFTSFARRAFSSQEAIFSYLDSNLSANADSSGYFCRNRFQLGMSRSISFISVGGCFLFWFFPPMGDYMKSASGSYVGLASSGTVIAGLPRFFIASSFFNRSYSSAHIRFSWSSFNRSSAFLTDSCARSSASERSLSMRSNAEAMFRLRSSSA